MSRGELHVAVGPMFCGKTTELLRRLSIMKAVRGPVLYINHSSDERFTKSAGDNVTTHNIAFGGKTGVDTIKVSKLDGLDVSSYDVVGVDEAQFFSDIQVVRRWKDDGKIVYVVGLDGDFKQEVFGYIYTLLPVSETFKKLRTARCKVCALQGDFNSQASFTRCVDGAEISGGIDVGGEEKYQAVCWRHTK